MLNRKWIKEIEEVEMEKVSHKLTLLCVKYIPVIVALADLVAILITFFTPLPMFISFTFSSSIITLIPMYIMSYAFKFCKYHRMIINYIVVNKVVYLIDYLFVLPLTIANLALLYLSLAGIFIALIIYNYLKYGDRNSA